MCNPFSRMDRRGWTEDQHVTPMHIAAGNGDIKIVKLLKDKKADCTKLDNFQV